MHILCLPHLPLPDQEVDDFAVAQSTPLPECIAGFEGDAVRSPPFSIAVLSLSSPKPSPLYTCKPTPSPCVQGGETYAEGFGISILIPKNFRHESFEAEETAKELTKKIKAEEDAKEMAKESAASKRATVAPTKKKTHQKPAKDTKTTEQTTTAPAPAKEDAPV